MSLFERRLQRLARAFGPKRRGLLLLRQLQGEQPQDAAWREGLPLEEREEFNQYVELLNAANCDLAVLICGLLQTVERLQVQAMLLETTLAWGEDVKQLRREQGKKHGDGLRFDALAPRLASRIRGELREEIETCWRDLLAIAQVLDEIAEEFDGQDPLMPPTRESFGECRTGLEELSGQLTLKLERKADVETVERVRQYAQQRSQLSPVVYLYKEEQALPSWRRRRR